MNTKVSLKSTWILIAFFAAMVPAITLMIWYGTTMYQLQLHSALAIERQANELLQSKIESKVTHFKTLLENKSDALSILLDKKDANSLHDINSLLRIVVAREPAINEVMLLDNNGNTIAVIDPLLGITGETLLPIEAMQVVAREWGFEDHIEYPEIIIPSFGRIYIGSPKKHGEISAFSISVPIATPAKAVLIAIIDIQYLQSSEEIENPGLQIDKTHDYILDRRGTLLTGIEDSMHRQGDLMTHLAITRAALTGGEWSSNTSYIGVNGELVYGTLTTIPSLNWTLVSEVISANLTQPIVDAMLKIGLITITGLFLFIGIVLTIVRKTLKPIQQACDAFEDVAKGDFHIALDSTNIRELDVMGASIKNMALARKEAERLLWQREQDLVITLNSIGDAVIATNAKGQITRMNPVAQRLTGWMSDEAQGQDIKSIFEIINASTKEAIENPIDKVLTTGETVHLSNHTTLISRTGKEYHIADSAAPIRNGNDEILGMVLVFNDITEQYNLRKQATADQLSLERKEKEQREILDSMVDAAISIDQNSIILSFNKAAETLFGYRLNEVLGKNVKLLMPDAIAQKHDGYVNSFVETGQARVIGLGREVEGKHKNSDIFPLRLLVAELPEDEHGTKRFIGSCIDLTYSKKQEEQLRQSQKRAALGKLTGGIAHDYNNMLGVIMGYSELLVEDLKDRPDLIRYVDNIRHAGTRGAKLTKQLLSFTKNSGAESTVFSLNVLARNTQHMLETTLTARINLAYDLDDDACFVFLDSGEMEDTIVNLSINAMHAIEGNGQITLSTRIKYLNDTDAQMLNLKPGNYVLLEITDTGCGMDKQTVEKIFDPFYSTKGENGTGLGLSQVYGFIERSDGAIEVYSQPGHGTRFSLYFPRSDQGGTDANNTPHTLPVSVKGGETILVVDDEPALTELAEHILSRQGYRVLTASSGKETLGILANAKHKKERIDLVITDVIMPNMDGYQLAAQVQKDYAHIKIQMVSGFSDDRNQPMVDETMHQNMLQKPYISKDLLTRVRKILDEN